MKKITAAAFAAVTALCFTACAQTAEEKPPVRLPEEFTVNAAIHDGDLNAEAELSRTAAGWSVVMTAPERVKGVCFELTDIECMASSGDLHYPMAAETMLGTSPLLLTTHALDGCVRGSDTGTAEGQSYRLDYKDGTPDTLTVGSMTVELSDLAFASR